MIVGEEYNLASWNKHLIFQDLKKEWIYGSISESISATNPSGNQKADLQVHSSKSTTGELNTARQAIQIELTETRTTRTN